MSDSRLGLTCLCAKLSSSRRLEEEAATISHENTECPELPSQRQSENLRGLASGLTEIQLTRVRRV